MLWWQYALWGLAGAAINRVLIYLEAAQRAKGPPWRAPQGPGGGVYSVSVLLHCIIGAVVVLAVGQSGYVANAVVALGIGAAAPVVVKKLSRYTVAVLPKTGDAEEQEEPDGS